MSDVIDSILEEQVAEIIEIFIPEHPVRDYLLQEFNIPIMVYHRSSAEDRLDPYVLMPYLRAMRMKQEKGFPYMVREIKTCPRGCNDVLGRRICGHDFGEYLAKDFRAWIRRRMDPAEELPCGGASFGFEESYAAVS